MLAAKRTADEVERTVRALERSAAADWDASQLTQARKRADGLLAEIDNLVYLVPHEDRSRRVTWKRCVRVFCVSPRSSGHGTELWAPPVVGSLLQQTQLSRLSDVSARRLREEQERAELLDGHAGKVGGVRQTGFTCPHLDI